VSITREETRYGKCPFCECQTTKNDRINADHVAIWCIECGATMEIPQGRMSYIEAINVLYDKWYCRPIEKSLQARIAELEKPAIEWHKYPDEKPINGGFYATYDGADVEAHFWRGGGEYWADMCSTEDDIAISEVTNITHWAYLPAPPKEESCKS